MYRRLSLTASLLLIAGSIPASSQDTCRVFTIPNPHGAAMTISSIFIADTVNFSVEPLRSVPFDIEATETWDARVCIKARDGARHSTSIRYMTTHGQAAFQLSMDAPGPSGIVDDARVRTVVTAYPSPSTGAVTLRLGNPVATRAVVTVVDASGAGTIVAPVSRAGDDLHIDLGTLAPGAYVIVVSVDGRFVGRASILLAR
jgi:hypothetical protein